MAIAPKSDPSSDRPEGNKAGQRAARRGFADAVASSTRLRLRPYRDADAFDLSRLLGDYEVARFTGSIPSPYPEACAQGWLVFQRWQALRSRAIHFAIETDTDPLVGSVGFFRRGANVDWEVGYWIGQSFWGRGYATEALGAALGWHDAVIGPRTVTAGYFEGNAASGRVLAKCGFVTLPRTTRHYSLARAARVTCIELERRPSSNAPGLNPHDPDAQGASL